MKQCEDKLDSKSSPHHPQTPALPRQPPDLGGHPTPEVGVRSPGIQHGGHHRLVLSDEQGQRVRVEDQVVRIHKLQNTRHGISVGRQSEPG